MNLAARPWQKTWRPTLKLSTAPTSEPITLTEAKQHCALDAAITDFDAQLSSYITAARQRIEDDTQRAFITQTWTAKLDCLPSECIELYRCPVASVSSITYVDTDGATQTWASTNYQVDTNSEPGRIIPAYGVSWPSYREQMHAITITFIAGYGAASAVPENAKQVIRYLIEQYWNSRSTLSDYELRAYNNLIRSITYSPNL